MPMATKVTLTEINVAHFYAKHFPVPQLKIVQLMRNQRIRLRAHSGFAK
jgi:hypothetical protein